jgi:hypothetical protein
LRRVGMAVNHKRGLVNVLGFQGDHQLRR